MPTIAAASRPFTPGTTGWTVHDLDDPAVAARWDAGAYEIVEGVLTIMAPAYFSGGNAAFNLAFFIKLHLRERGLPGRFAHEVDIVLSDARVTRADAVFLSPEDESRQAAAVRAGGAGDVHRTRLLIPPTLIIESVSPGHESHDRATKRAWYAEFGVPNYWIIDAFQKSLQCLTLENGVHVEDTAARGDAEIQPSLFSGLNLNLREVWQG